MGSNNPGRIVLRCYSINHYLRNEHKLNGLTSSGPLWVPDDTRLSRRTGPMEIQPRRTLLSAVHGAGAFSRAVGVLSVNQEGEATMPRRNPRSKTQPSPCAIGGLPCLGVEANPGLGECLVAASYHTFDAKSSNQNKTSTETNTRGNSSRKGGYV
jgi:hypothetical protein